MLFYRVFSGKVVSFNAIWKPERPFPIDMASFAVSMHLLTSNRQAAFKYDVPRGYQVDFVFDRFFLDFYDI